LRAGNFDRQAGRNIGAKIIEKTNAFVSILIDRYRNDGRNNAPEISRPQSGETSVTRREIHSTKSVLID